MDQSVQKSTETSTVCWEWIEFSLEMKELTMVLPYLFSDFVKKKKLKWLMEIKYIELQLIHW